MRDRNLHLRAMPLVASMLGDKLGVRVVVGQSDTAYTNGNTIFLPSLPVEADDTLLGLLSGYIDHEAAHIRHTDFHRLHVSRLRPLEKHIWNFIEDWRVEHELVKRYPGCRDHFLWLIRHLFLPTSSTLEAAEEQDSPAVSILNYLLLTLRSWDVQELISSCEKEAGIIENLWPGMKKKLDRQLRELPDRCLTTEDSIAFARKIVRILEHYAQDEKQAIQPPQFKFKSADNASPVPLVSDAENDQNEAEDGSMLLPLTKLFQTPIDALPQDVGRLLASSISSFHEETDHGLRMAEAGELHVGTLDGEEIAGARAASCAMKHRLQGMLQAQRLRRISPSRFGHLDARNTHRLVVLDPCIFRTGAYVTGANTAVHILLDISLSMSTNIHLACQACYAVASTLSAIPGINTGVTAFPAEARHGCENTVFPVVRHGERVTSQLKLSADGTTPMADALLWVVKQMMPLQETRKIVLLISDGLPDNIPATMNTLDVVRRLGIEVAGISIASQHLADLIHTQETITDIHELAPAMFRVLQQLFTTRRKK